MLSRSMVPMESANWDWRPSTSYSRDHISLTAVLTSLPKLAFSSARGISSGRISARMDWTTALMSSEMLKWNLSILFLTRHHSSRSRSMVQGQGQVQVQVQVVAGVRLGTGEDTLPC